MAIIDIEKLPVANALTITDANGMMQMRYVEKYQVITDSKDDSAFVAINSQSLPQFNSSITVVTGHELFCKSISPMRDLKARTKWIITYTFINTTIHREFSPFYTEDGTPITDPTAEQSRVKVTYKTEPEEVRDATLIKMRHQNQDFGSWQRPQSMKTQGVVTNSAGEPFPVYRTAQTRVFSVSKVYRDWSSAWDTLTGKVNSSAFTITRADATGTRASWQFGERKMRMDSVDPREVRFNGNLYFDVTFVMSESKNEEGWLHYQPDVGLNHSVFDGQYKNLIGATADQYTASDVETNLAPIMAFNAAAVTTDLTPDRDVIVPITDPVLLNGYGQESGRQAPYGYSVDSSFESVWAIYQEQDFSALGM